MCSIPDHRARTGTPHDVTSDPDPSRPHGPGFTGFGPATVASTVRSHVALSAARLLSATDVTCLTDDECLGVFDDLEAVQRSLDAIGAMVVSEIDGRDLCDTRYGISTRVWFERRHGRSRGTIGRQASAGRKLRRDLPQIAHALARGEITGERAMYVVSKLNVRNTDALAAAQQGLLALSASEPSFAQFCVLVNDLARFADADGSDEPSAATNSARVHRVNDEVAVSATYVDADGESFEQLVEAAANALWRRWRRDCDANPDLDMPTRTQIRAEALLELVRRGAAADPTNARPTVTELSLVVDADRVDELNPILAGVMDGTGRHVDPAHRHHFDDHGRFCCGHGDRVAVPVTSPDGRRVTVSALQWELLVCNASVSEVLLDALGMPVAVRDRLRHPSAAMRRGLVVRDGGCAFPGCDHPPAWCDAHHVIEWAADGRTVIVNLVLLCRRHHGVVHRTGWSVALNTDRGDGDGFFTITTPSGLTMTTQHRPRPPSPSGAAPPGSPPSGPPPTGRSPAPA